MIQSDAGNQDPSLTVKNTFLELSIPTEDAASQSRRQRTRSDGTDIRNSPLVVAAKSPIGSPLLQPVDETMQAVPIDEVNFELLEEAALPDAGVPRTRFGSEGEVVAQVAAGLGRDEPAYVVPNTPSPFLHSAFPPSVVPPFGAFGYGMSDMGLPPAYGEGGEEGQDVDGHFVQDVDGQFMQGMQFMPEMYDPNYGQYMPYGWPGVGVDGTAEGQEVMPGSPEGPVPEAFTGGQPSQEMQSMSGYLEEVNRRRQLLQARNRHQVPPELQESEEVVQAQPCEEQVPIPPAARSHEEAVQEAPVEQDVAGSRRGKGKSRALPAEESPGRAGNGKSGGRGGDSPPARGNASSEAASGQAGGAGGAEEKQTAMTTPAESNETSNDNKAMGNCTTVMLRNIPNKYTREMLIKQLNVDFNGEYDFMYLPIDFKNKCNVGYGFINFRSSGVCDKFVKDFHGVDVRKCLPGLNSKKVVEVTPARVQGLTENVRRLRNSPVMNQLVDHPEWMPLLFNDAGVEIPFPMPDQPLPPVKPRGRRNEATKDVS
mmetsp:Transcript_70397/g.139655  ORF Transcript_70397/g.139655 Transcript_70397/m.139655 type:complete len:540 (-) Transcript_70397:117-1736(-)